MRKGLTKKLTIILLALTMSVSPFLYTPIYADETIIDWDSFGVPTYQTGAYAYWYEYGLSNIAYQEQQDTGFVITTSYGQHNYNVTREGVLSTEQYTLYVYSTTGARMGKFIGYNEKTTTANGNIAYLSSNNTQSYCANCYVGFETDPNDIIRLTEAQHNSTTSGNDTYVNRLQYVVPSLKGVYSHPTTYNNRYKGIAYRNDEYVISFMSNLKLQYKTPSLQMISDRDISDLTLSQVNQTNIGNWDLRTYKVVNNGNSALPFDWYISNFNNQNVEIIPIYQGSVSQMPADLYQLAYGKKYIYETHDNELIQIMANGNNSSQQSVDDADNINNELTNSDNEYSTLENQFSSDLNTNLNNIDNSLNLNNNSSFIASANYVKDRFNRFTNNMPAINLVITFSLLVGLTTLLIGKVFK